METYLFWLVPIASILALAFAGYFYKQMMRESEGSPEMQKIAAHVRKPGRRLPLNTRDGVEVEPLEPA